MMPAQRQETITVRTHAGSGSIDPFNRPHSTRRSQQLVEGPLWNICPLAEPQASMTLIVHVLHHRQSQRADAAMGSKTIWQVTHFAAPAVHQLSRWLLCGGRFR